MSYIYIAHPIDYADQSESAPWSRCVEMLSDRGLSSYSPAMAWSGVSGPTANIQRVNLDAIRGAAAVLAVWPRGVFSYGTGVEIGYAAALGVSVFAVADTSSVALCDTPNIRVFDDLLHAVDALSSYVSSNESGSAVALFAGDGTTPSRAYESDAGWDLAYCGPDQIVIPPDGFVRVPFGVAIKWPRGMWGLLLPRSSSNIRGLHIPPSVIDHGYTGPLFAMVRNKSSVDVTISPGDRVAQIIPMPTHSVGMRFVRVDSLPRSDRGDNGYGSSGR